MLIDTPYQNKPKYEGFNANSQSQRSKSEKNLQDQVFKLKYSSRGIDQIELEKRKPYQ